MATKTDNEIFQDAWIEMHSNEWLFPDNRNLTNERGQKIDGPASADEYLRHFANRRTMFQYRCPAPYKFSLLENNKDKLVLSSHRTHEGMTVPYSVFQLSYPSTHLVTDWIWDSGAEKFYFPATLYVEDAKSYIDFLKNHRELEYVHKRDGLGFGGKGR